jgi:hypothetical protein
MAEASFDWPYERPGNKAPSYFPEVYETRRRITLFVDAKDFGYGPIWRRQNKPFGALVSTKCDNDGWEYMRGDSPPPHQLGGLGYKLPGVETLWNAFRDALRHQLARDMIHPCKYGPLSCCTQPCRVSGDERTCQASLQKLVGEWAPKWAAHGITLSYYDKTGRYSFKRSVEMSVQVGVGRFTAFGVMLDTPGAPSPGGSIAPVPPMGMSVPVGPAPAEMERGMALSVVVPPGAVPGTVLEATGSAGQKVHVTVPSGVLPGQSLQFTA